MHTMGATLEVLEQLRAQVELLAEATKEAGHFFASLEGSFGLKTRWEDDGRFKG